MPITREQYRKDMSRMREAQKLKSSLHVNKDGHASTATLTMRTDIIKGLQAEIKRKLTKVSHLVARGRYDAAGYVCGLVVADRSKLAAMIAAQDSEASRPDTRKPAEPIRHSQAKVKRYKTWSDK